MEQIDLLRRVIEVLEEMDVTYMVVGSYASNALGEPRFTQDIDIVVSLIPEDVTILCRAFKEPEFYLDDLAARQAINLEGMFNLIHPASGGKVDFIVSRRDQWSRHQLANRQRIRLLPDRESYVSKTEDVIVNKMLFFREGGSEKHLRDITGVMKMQGDRIDRDYIYRWSAEMGLIEIWETILSRLA